jgi:glycolate oxidase FAD binding subunit
MFQATTTEDVQQFVRQQPRVRVRGRGTKAGLTQDATLSVTALSGVVEYEPSEFTFTAQAGTPLREIRELLDGHRQFLAFDPVLVEAGGSLGGAIATGLSGPGRFRYGGVRDFLLGVRLVNGEGDVVRGGGKVVKNAAGFDIPKLMVGALGQFGVLTEATFKVFPQPETYTTLRVTYPGLDAALPDMTRLAMSPAEASCLELVAPATLLVRIGGMSSASAQRVSRLRGLLSGTVEVLSAEEDKLTWREAREFEWIPESHRLLKVPILPGQIATWEKLLATSAAGPRRYGVGGHLLWLTWPNSEPWERLDEILHTTRRAAFVVLGPTNTAWRGSLAGGPFAERLISTFDPAGKFSLTSPKGEIAVSSL